MSSSWKTAISVGAAVLFSASAAVAGGIRPLFDLSQPAGGPFPSDRFTVLDALQNTGLRINLPKVDDSGLPLDCVTQRSSCEDIDTLNELDGFNSLPRISIPFSDDIDPATVTSETVFLVSLGNTRHDGVGRGKVIGINRRVWDVATKTLHVEADELLDQHTRYLVVVTRGVRDASGVPIEHADAFRSFRDGLRFGASRDLALVRYGVTLIGAVAQAAAARAVDVRNIAAASVFTTQSVTTVLERMGTQVKAAPTDPADFVIASAVGTPGVLRRAVFPFADVQRIEFTRQGIRATMAEPLTVDVPMTALQSTPPVIGQVAFGKFVSLDYRDSDGIIPAVGTRSGVPDAVTTDIFFTLYLPACPKLPAGWPIVIFSHGLGGDKEITVAAAARTLAAHCMATIGINSVGHGYGAGGVVTLTGLPEGPVTVPSGGRGINRNGDNFIEATEGLFASSPSSLVVIRDSIRQTVVDLMRLVRVIEVEMDVDGDGFADVDPSRIYYVGQSLGGLVGTVLLAVEPSIRVGVLNVAGGPPIEVARLNPGLNLRGIARDIFGSRTPSLLNASPSAPLLGFDENMPLRNETPRINTTAGAMDLQTVLDRIKWVGQSGDPVPYAPHLRKQPLSGMPAKDVLVQFAKGDLTLPNPATTALIRAGDLADRATYFRNDLFVATLPPGTVCAAGLRNPHNFVLNLTVFQRFAQRVEAQTQIARFFATDGADTIDPDPPGQNFWEVPVESLPEETNFLPAAPLPCVP